MATADYRAFTPELRGVVWSGNWFPMALKDGARSWLLNLPAGTISSWGEMRERFVANF